MDKKIAHTEAGFENVTNKKDTSTVNQQNIILQALKNSPKTTIELRHDYGIMQPAPRILELREQGYKIDTVRVAGLTHDGIKHHAVAKYVLRGVANE